MATVVDADRLAEVLTARIQRKLEVLQPTNPRLKEILLRIGINIQSEAKLNIQRAGLIDTGRLINSIRYLALQKGDTTEIVVGSFAVPYAAVHEFGFNGTVGVPQSNVRGHARVYRGRDVQVSAHTRRAHSRQMIIKGHHYLERAAQGVVDKVPRIIGQMFRGL